jgi:drug/metabolite transporter (DMT)-like permease
VALIHVPVSVMPCITATSFVWVFVMGVLILKEKVSRRRALGVAIIILGVIISRL